MLILLQAILMLRYVALFFVCFNVVFYLPISLSDLDRPNSAKKHCHYCVICMSKYIKIFILNNITDVSYEVFYIFTLML